MVGEYGLLLAPSALPPLFAVVLARHEGAWRRARRIKAALADCLPSYMIPRKILAVESFPLNTNGKIDKKQLAAQLASGTTGGRT